TAKGSNIVNVLPIEQGEKVTAMIHVREFTDDRYLMMITRNGTVKRITLASINTARKAGIRAITLEEGDELIGVRETDGEQNILLATHNGAAICFKETDVRIMGRDACGVRGIRLKQDDYVIGAARTHEGGTLLAVTENGYGKRTPLSEYIRGSGDEPQSRGGSGMRGYQVTEKTGKLAGIKVVDEDDDILLISDDGTIIRMAANTVNVYSRTAQGVILMRLDEGVKVISLARTEKEEEEPEFELADETDETDEE
ncbi:MAG: DNA gyrase C-terminal beta-propeller domain-containing protein, partial [Oscillospiraceae bacterium]